MYLIIEDKPESKMSFLMDKLPKDDALVVLTMVCLRASISKIVKDGVELCLLRDISKRLDRYHIGGGNYRVKPDPANELILESLDDIRKIKCIIEEYLIDEDQIRKMKDVLKYYLIDEEL